MQAPHPHAASLRGVQHVVDRLRGYRDGGRARRTRVSLDPPQLPPLCLPYTGFLCFASISVAMNRKKLLPTFAWICLFVLGSVGLVWLVDSILAAFP
jgi:hypothetical protein